MGRFYRTSEAKPLDFMHKLPIELMMRGIQQTDAANDAIYQQTDLLNNTVANVNHLIPDAERVKARQAEINDKIEEVTKTLAEDPTSYRKHMPTVRNLAREVTDDLTNGELSAIQSNASRLTEWDKTYKPKVASGEITPQAYSLMKNAFLKEFTNGGGTKYDPQTGTYNQIAVEDVVKTQDFAKLLKDKIGQIKASSKEWKKDRLTGGWIETDSGKTEEVSTAKAAMIALETLKSDPNVAAYIKQGSKYGYLPGTYEDNINPITDFDEKTGNPVFNPNSILTSPIRGLMLQQAYQKTKQEQTYKENPYEMKKLDFSMDMAKMAAADQIHDKNELVEGANKLKDAERLETIKDKHNKENIRLRAELRPLTAAELAAQKAGKTTNNKVTPIGVPAITASPDGTFLARPFGGDKMETPEKVDKELEHLKSEAANALLMTKTASSDNERAKYQKEYNDKMVQFDKYNTLAQLSRDYTNESLLKGGATSGIKWKQEDLGLLTTYPREKQRLEQAINTTQAIMSKSGTPNFDEAKTLIVQKKKLLDLNHKYETLSKDAQELTSKWFTDNQSRNTQRVENVGLDVPQKKLLYKALTANPDGFDILNLNTDEITALPKKAPIQALGIAKVPIDDIKEAIRNGNAESLIDIQAVNNAIPGVGTTITFKMKGDLGKSTDNETFLMTIPSQVETSLSHALANSNSSSHKEMAGKLANKVKNDMLSSIKNKIVDYNGHNGEPAGYFTFHNEDAGYDPTIKVVPIRSKTNNSDVVMYETKISKQDGSWTEFKLPIKDSDGKTHMTSQFDNEEAIAEAYSHWLPSTK